MNFVELDENEYRTFWKQHPLKTFLSSPEIGTLRKKNGWDLKYVGLIKNDILVCAAMLVSHTRRFGKKEFYAPRGVLIDYNDRELLDTFIKQLKRYIKSNGGYVFRIDPYVINKERNIDGDIVEDGVDNTDIKNSLLKLGFKQVENEKMEQVGWMFSLDLEGKTEEEILKEMKPNTRNTIKKVEKLGVEIKELKKEELDQFMDILESTGNRKSFHVRKIDYYKDMYDLFHDKGEVKFLITKLDLNKYLHDLREDKKSLKERLEKIKDNAHSEGERKELTEQIEVLNNKENDTKDLIERSGKDKIILSGSMFIMIQPEVVYLSSGNYEEYLHFNSQYLIQWYMIKYGIENGFKKYNFYGIPANINEHPKDYGIYKFKKGFNGYVEELIGEYELPITWHYRLMKLIHKVK